MKYGVKQCGDNWKKEEIRKVINYTNQNDEKARQIKWHEHSLDSKQS